MDPNVKSALIGLHEHLNLETMVGLAQTKGYQVDSCSTPERMRELTGSDLYRMYIMDVNLGHPGSEEVGIALEVYRMIKGRLENKEAKLMIVSATDGAIQKAMGLGIPKEYFKTKDRGIDFLREFFTD
ncbi:hypothetical protein HYV84_07485 [Candidatus Woesearchaeota archaeon]|nr:hypothetical protein [Candidatus Woesearchaeota archaeon]